MTIPEETPDRSRRRDPSSPDKIPVMAQRTYSFIRLGVVAVIVVLAVSLAKQYAAADCLQGSISAYYYLPVRSVFVGALVALGFALIALWGKTPYEDGFLNLAGMLAPVVAFVPTGEARKCGLTDADGEPVRTQDEKEAVIAASHDAVANNMFAYLLVIGIVLAVVLVVGIFAHRRQRDWLVEQPWAFWLPWAGAVVLWVSGTLLFSRHDVWFYDNAHKWSAVFLFVFILCAIVAIGVDKWQGNGSTHDIPSRRWAVAYWILAGVMVVGAVAIFLGVEHGHRIFWVEAWMIGWLAVFWTLQTWDRWGEGAPRTKAEVAAQDGAPAL